MIFRYSQATLAVLFLICAFCGSAQAQFMTNIKLNKEIFLTHEGVEATITVSNRSGADIVMGGPNGLPWLTFDITDPDGRPSPALRARNEGTMVFKAGSTISRKILLSNFYSFSQYGNYFIAASIYYPPTQQYYGSNRVRANFTDTKAFWEQSYGVPTGLPNAGQLRRYTLSTMRDYDRTYLYVRIIEEKTKLKLATFSLGACIMVSDPQVTVDKDNKLHVLFMAVPHVYAHVVVDTQGAIYRRNYYREVKEDRPQMIVQADGNIGVSGGVPFDPSAPAQDPTKPQGRSIGETPPGL